MIGAPRFPAGLSPEVFDADFDDRLCGARGRRLCDQERKSDGLHGAGSGNGGVHDVGKYLLVWKKQPDGGWKVLREIYNTDLPAPKM